MCGITGFVGMDNEALLRGMCASLTHRGPDDAGFYTAPGVGLAMRRLSVIDLATGRQPITNEAGDVWVVFNGEIYNYEQLRTDLEARGHRFATRTDTETLVHLYEDYGVDFVGHLRGMFAIALWDARRRRLVVARDRIGEKPLYYLFDGRRLIFGSEIKAILAAGVARRADPQAIREFLAIGYVPGSRTVFADIAKLPPAHLLVFEQRRLSIQRYWTRSAGAGSPTEQEARDELGQRLGETVRLCLKSDVEVGAFLSGGVDSSLLVALMRREAAEVQTFTVGYQGNATGFNELAPAGAVARRLGTRHHQLILGASSSIDLLPRILWHYDEPHAEPTSVLMYQLSEFARQRVKVAIGGTGGDEIFFGYPRHMGIRYLDYYRRLPRTVRQTLIERVAARWPASTRGSRFAKRVKRFVGAGDAAAGEAYLGWVRLLGRELHASLTSDASVSVDDPAGDRFLRDHLIGVPDDRVLDAAAALDVDGYLPEYQLAYVDRMSMAHGLEVRSPLCDFTLVEFALSLPAHYRLRRFRSKHLLKEVAREWLPPTIVDRAKVGFDSPIGEWFKRELRSFLQEFLSAEHLARTGLLNPSAVEQMIGLHLAGRQDYSLQLWSVVMLEAWHRMYIDGAATADCRLADLRGGAEAVGA
ncbi:MAG: asparagine synthase (glutamine-hydrolyzing) [Vicinamibacterales bacterium]